MRLQILGIDHVVLRVYDMARMRAFYCDVLGCVLEREQPELDLVQLRAGDALIDLVDVAGKIGRQGGRAPQADGRNMDHFCLRVASFEATQIRSHLESAGVEVGDLATRYGAEGAGPSLYIRDPEGNTVELKGSV
ncbi:VOC family protein [Pandoraea sp.]|uniref:VOC family protein n=1 Tax=Pandoraea sp. TaxID=1883445 RepID=UPI0012079C4D|nr:VOC family protein [Pandoraea sp.]MDE2286946.1 VOC family protein [Burkholderiales bacterium]TAL56146.1 MAG: VOC family protein [Pandoraea sp.]TAM16717.1 MAG: VOC family protein [Pandoraea sp.]